MSDETRRKLKDVAIIVNTLAASSGMVYGLLSLLGIGC
jgi:hypothetical protein